MKTWGIRLGSYGSQIDFCENQKIVGIGWNSVPAELMKSNNKDEIVQFLMEFYPTRKKAGIAASQLTRFYHSINVGDYILYYNPPKKNVTIAKVESAASYRDFDLHKKDSDIWHYRKVSYPCPPIPITRFDAVLKWSLLGPKLSIWNIEQDSKRVDLLAQGLDPKQLEVPDIDISNAHEKLSELISKRLQSLDEIDLELLVSDYFEFSGLKVIGSVGGNRTLIDVEGQLGCGAFEERWVAQVKRRQNSKIDWPEIVDYFEKSDYDNFCFVSLFGFTDRAHEENDNFHDDDKNRLSNIVLLEAKDFVDMVITRKCSEKILKKIQW